MTQLIYPMAAVLAFDASLLFFLTWAYYSPRAAAYRISPKTSMKVSAARRLVNIAINSALSLVYVFGLLYLLAPVMIHDQPASVLAVALSTLEVLIVYDFLYYWLHRAMHVKALMKWVHGVHHRVHNPTAMESFYLSPIELLAGIALLMGCTWAVGPVSSAAFVAIFFIHSTLNIVVHSGLVSGHWLMKPLDHLMRAHHIHHRGDLGANLASLTPIPDLIFGTAR